MAQPQPIRVNARTPKSAVFLLVKFLNCVLNNSGFKIPCNNNYFYGSPSTEGLFVITVTQQ